MGSLGWRQNFGASGAAPNGWEGRAAGATRTFSPNVTEKMAAAPVSNDFCLRWYSANREKTRCTHIILARARNHAHSHAVPGRDLPERERRRVLHALRRGDGAVRHRHDAADSVRRRPPAPVPGGAHLQRRGRARAGALEQRGRRAGRPAGRERNVRLICVRVACA